MTKNLLLNASLRICVFVYTKVHQRSSGSSIGWYATTIQNWRMAIILSFSIFEKKKTVQQYLPHAFAFLCFPNCRHSVHVHLRLFDCIEHVFTQNCGNCVEKKCMKTCFYRHFCLLWRWKGHTHTLNVVTRSSRTKELNSTLAPRLCLTTENG